MQMIKMPVRIASVALMSLASWKFAAAGTVPQGWQQGPSDAWFVNWDDAVAEAKKTQKPIFVLKTGSDWCGWCIRLRKNVLSKPEFEAFAAKNLVLLYLDSPSKSPLCDEQKSHNQQVSRQLHLGGGVPNASVVTTDGKKLGTISGGALGLEDYLKRLEDIVENTTGGEIREPTSSLRDVKASYKSETVGGLSWRYRVSGGKAIVEAPIERGKVARSCGREIAFGVREGAGQLGRFSGRRHWQTGVLLL